MPKYIASRISATHNSLFPDELEIDFINVTYYKVAVEVIILLSSQEII